MKNCAFIVATGLIAAAAHATPLVPTGVVTPIPVFPTTLSAATVASGVNTSIFTSPGGLFSGELRSQVFTNCADNPYGLNALTFGYVILNYATSQNSIGRFTINGFGTFFTDVGSEPLTNAPGFTDALFNDRPVGNELGWTFVDANIGAVDYDRLMPGATSRIFVVHTNATAYTIDSASVIDGDIATANAFVPAPTPGAGALLGLGTLAAFRRRR